MQASFYEYIKKGASTTTVVTYNGALMASEPPRTIEQESQPRSVIIRADDLETHGYTAGCQGCAWVTVSVMNYG